MFDRISVQLIKAYGLTSSIFGITQALLWFFMCLTSLLYITKIVEYNRFNQDASLQIRNDLYDLFFNDDVPANAKAYVDPDAFFVVTLVYLFGYLAWLTSSAFLFWMSVKERWDKAKSVLVAWTAITSALLAADLVLLAFLGIDYEGIVSEKDIYKDLAYVIVMIITARGGILWIINAVFVVLYTIIITKHFAMFSKRSAPRRMIRAPDDGPTVNTTLIRDEDPSTGNYHDNIAYESDKIEDASYFGDAIPKIPRLLPQRPPKIPTPDYTPPGTPCALVRRAFSEFEPLKF